MPMIPLRSSSCSACVRIYVFACVREFSCMGTYAGNVGKHARHSLRIVYKIGAVTRSGPGPEKIRVSAPFECPLPLPDQRT